MTGYSSAILVSSSTIEANIRISIGERSAFRAVSYTHLSGKGSLDNNRISTPAKEVEKIPVQKNLFEEEEKRFPIEEKNTKAEEILRPAVSVASIPTAKGKKVKRIILFFEDGSFEDYEK